jgi:hypothetical protein
VKQSLYQTFALPAALLLVTMAGLTLGLVADGGWDWLANALMLVPLAVIALRTVFRGNRSRS